MRLQKTYRGGVLWPRKEPRGSKEIYAERLGFWVTVCGTVMSPNGGPAKMLYNQFSGYNVFKAGRKLVLAHRFIFHYLVRPIDPKKVIDHINGNRSDNSLSNLREVSISENGRNRGHQWQNLEVGQ